MANENETIDRLLPMVRKAEDSADSAVSPKGAVGRYQIMPATARALGFDPARLKDPDYNEQVARAAIKDLIGQHGQDDKAILAGYNASPTAVERWKKSGRNDLVLPKETQNYFKRAGYKDEPTNTPAKPAEPPAELPNVDEAFGADTGLPDADKVFGIEQDPGALRAADQAIQRSMFRIQNAFGVGAKAGFGEEPIATPETALSPETKKTMRDLGLFNDYAKGQTDFTRSMFESIFRPAAAALELAGRTINAGLFGAAEAAGAAVEETGAVSPGGLTGAGGLRGALTDPSLIMAFPPAEFTAARAHGVLGEGEAGHFETIPLSPKNAQARVDAANDAGIEIPVPQAFGKRTDTARLPEPAEPTGGLGTAPQAGLEEAPMTATPDLHVIARRIDPETFYQYDTLAAQKEQYRQTLSDLAAERAALPEAVAAKDEINTILGKVHGVEERLTKKAAARLADAQDQLERLLHTDTPSMAKERKALLDADIAMRDLAPDVASAYQQAKEIMPEPEVTPAVEMEAASKGEVPEPAKAPPVTPGKPQAIPAKEPAVQPAKETSVTLPSQEPAPRLTASIALKPVAGTGDIVTRKLAEGVEAKAIESDLVDKFGDLPEYRQVTMADQAAQAAALLNEDYDRAKAIAMGLKQPPKNVLPESVFVAVEKRALAEGDVDTLRQLATESKLTTAATTMGQRIRTLGERDPASPVGAIQDIQAARAAELERRSGASAIKEAIDAVKAELRRSSATQEDWKDFIAAITCEGE